jgi:type I restriction enzyme M protein
VISLSAGVFKPSAGVKTGVLVFRKPMTDVKGTQKSGNVWFYEGRNDGYDPDKIVGGRRPETPEKTNIPALLREWKVYRDSGIRDPPGVEGGTLLPPGSDEPRCWWASNDSIAENDYNLAAGRYKPQVAENAPEN